MNRATAALFHALFLIVALCAAASADSAPSDAGLLAVDEISLDNGIRLLLVDRPQMTTVTAGWVARVGSVDERPGKTGLTHLLEHLLFKGTRTVGARNLERELAGLEEEDRLAERIEEGYRELRRRARRGEIADPFDPAVRPAELVELERRFADLADRNRSLAAPGELARLYAEGGASSLNALTLKDMTLYFVTLPAPRLELWFWLESDRLAQPVFRELYTERRVVEEERRQRTESTATGPFDQQLVAAFWQAHPYSWPVLGWPSDVASLDRQDAGRHFQTFYGGRNLTLALVGRFDRARVEEWARRYFGRLPAGRERPEIVTLEPRQRAEQRLISRCDCRPQAKILYHAAPFGHRDQAALEVLAGLLNGRTGRLYRSLVVDRQLAHSAYGLSQPMRWAGRFTVVVESRGVASPEELLAAWDAELERLRREPVGPRELDKVKNQIAADAFRRLEEPAGLMMQLLTYDALGDWRAIETGARRALQVTPADLQRVVERYFAPHNRTVGLYYRTGAAGVEGEAPR